jgi:hypothetical protein
VEGPGRYVDGHEHTMKVVEWCRDKNFLKTRVSLRRGTETKPTMAADPYFGLNRAFDFVIGAKAPRTDL